MTNCIFCAVAEGISPAFKIWENDKFIAFLDIFPNTKGQTLLIPKKHYESDLFLIEDGTFYEQYFLAAKEVVDMLKKSL
jgi:diadenosine tetraphosphate (Ap4A) HIT family hydrolase